MKKAFTIIGVILITSLIITGCGSKEPIMSAGEYHEAGFFLGIFGGLLWPITFIFYLIGFISHYWGVSAMYYHYNSGFGYWLGYCIGFLPYLLVLLVFIPANKKNKEENKNNKS